VARAAADKIGGRLGPALMGRLNDEDGEAEAEGAKDATE
jgi:hypothetical protein